MGREVGRRDMRSCFVPDHLLKSTRLGSHARGHRHRGCNPDRLNRRPGLPLALHWFDTRASAAEQPGVAHVPEEAIEACVADAPGDAAILILTHDHGLDYRLAAASLRGEARFVGLIGSATKRARFLSQLAKDGFDAAARARLTCPIGLPEIAGKEPDVIAIAALAQLLTLRRAGA